MPKRDAAYMEAQRETIARAALDVLLEKGLYETSLRDICQRAGISIGALYIHFATKEEAVAAACMLDHLDRQDRPPANSWEAYVQLYTYDELNRDQERARKRFRLSLQFVAELALMDHNPPGLSAVYHLYQEQVRTHLNHLHEIGEISLPLGLEMTTELHMQLVGGAAYRMASDRDVAEAAVEKALRTGLALTVGRAGAAAGKPRKAAKAGT